MLGKLRANGHGFFIILPDLPSRDPPYLPGLCYKKSRGLLSRVAESNESGRWVFESTRLFSSREGEKIEEWSCPVNCLDTFTVSVEFVENVDRFIDIMDEISNGGFLRGEESELAGDWVEFDWLKAKGYYSIEAFIVNRLEVGLRLAWLNCNNGKKRGVKLKEKLNAAGMAANVYWRKKGCVDWWMNLDDAMRRKVLTVILGKAAKSLVLSRNPTHEVLKEASNALEDGMWLFNAGMKQSSRFYHSKSLQRTISTLSVDVECGLAISPASLSGIPASLATVFSGLFVLQDITTMVLSSQHNEYDIEKIFFSSLRFVSTTTDCLLRKLRGLLMVVSLDCTKLELFGEGNFKSSPNKSKEKPSTIGRRKKCRACSTKRQNPLPKSALDELSLDKPPKDPEGALTDTEKVDLMGSDKVPGISNGKDINRETSTSEMEMVVCHQEHARALVAGKGRTNARKTKTVKNKNKNCTYNNPVPVKDPKVSVLETSSSISLQDEVEKYDKLSAQNVSVDNSTCSNVLASNQSSCTSASVPAREGIATQSTQEDCVVNSVNSECRRFSNGRIDNQTQHFLQETTDSKVECNIISPDMPARDLDNAFGNSISGINFQNSFHESETGAISVLPDKGIEALEIKKESAVTQDQRNESFFGTALKSSLECPSYEWPTIAPVYFPSISSHLLPATDRLHLDVGHNWHNHVRQPFVPTLHQARNHPFDGGCNQILSQPLPMSLDWPPMVQNVSGIAPSVTCNYDSGFISSRQSGFQQNFATKGMQFNAKTSDDEGKCSGDFMDLPEPTTTQEQGDECDSHWLSEEELEVHTVSGIDYNQYFGGGVMYWNTSDHPGTGFSRPPSLSSDDSSWAWHEADIKRAVDDMVAFSSSYSTNGLTSPTAASFCSPFDPLGPGHQAFSYVVPGNEVPGKVLHSSSTTTDVATEEEISGSFASLSGDVDSKALDTLPCPILRPIIIPNLSRERSRSDFKRSHEHKSPCVPPSRREQPRIKRPPSPVVLCVPRAPRPPPPSPVSDSRKTRGFPTVRSGSSSPRHWGVRGWYHEGTTSEEGCVRMDGSEVVWPSWRNKNLSAHPMIQPLSGALLQDHLIAISQLARDQEHPDVAFPLQPLEVQNCPTRKASLSLMHSLLHEEIDSFCKQVAAENTARKPYINWAVKRVTRSLQVLWPRSRTNIFGSNATGLSLPSSDVDLVVCLPPVRNLEPIKEAGILEGRNGIKETCLQIPIIMLVVEVPHDLIASAASSVQSPKEDAAHTTLKHDNHVHSDMVALDDSASPKCSHTSSDNIKAATSVRLDISFKSPSHTGLQTTDLVKELTEQFPASTPLALVLKQFLADRSLDQSYSGGLSSYCLNYGRLLMDFLYFFGNVFDPRQMRISVQGSGVYIKRERGYSEDGDKAGRKPLPYLGILPVSFLVDFCLPEGVHSVKLPYCVSSFYIQTSTRKTSFLGAAYSIVASCLCFAKVLEDKPDCLDISGLDSINMHMHIF
ncbi:NTP transf 2 domain-containing protein [Citrus sinensis]|uniref:NTP transf 2 domain-containing protein n=1 Tax=Citrus sinensis TaxID=2711 RepID=A0ACB8MTG3_CITSI|nr:NTP transf 2 domain-containing protein [Citrus sinensis]